YAFTCTAAFISLLSFCLSFTFIRFNTLCIRLLRTAITLYKEHLLLSFIALLPSTFSVIV
ncbi:hypothetical protein, partial [Plesiomonas sp.]|uniref:hypothetical protein n=1 Tax=Plesiomonas sp. TaxID=2486279 RepID=UPI003F33D8BE